MKYHKASIFLFTARAAEIVPSEVVPGGAVPVCGDNKSWSYCLDIYRLGQCGEEINCDRTCQKCIGVQCYDRIPVIHDFLHSRSLPVRSIWPNHYNDQTNHYPTLNRNTKEDFPFDKRGISFFCMEMFYYGYCELQDVLLYYGDEAIKLLGHGSDYCRFTCGKCSETNNCYRKHNNAMQALQNTRQNEVSWKVKKAQEEEDPWNLWMEDPWNLSSWRRRRSVNTGRAYNDFSFKTVFSSALHGQKKLDRTVNPYARVQSIYDTFSEQARNYKRKNIIATLNTCFDKPISEH